MITIIAVLAGIIVFIVLAALLYAPFVLSARISDEEEKRGIRRS